MSVKEEQTLNHLLYGALGSLTGITLLAGIVISNNSQVSATASRVVSSDVSVTVQSSCTMVGNIASEQDQHTKVVNNGTYTPNIGLTTITAYCNDANGLMIYAIGYSGDTEGNNTMINTTNSDNYFPSGTLQSGSTSQWAMKIGTTATTYAMTNIVSPYNDYATVPTEYTPVAYRTSGTDAGASATGTNITTTYAAYISGTQTAGTYVGKVKYTLYHPYTDQDLSTLEEVLYASGAEKNARGTDGNDYYALQDFTASVCSASGVTAGDAGSFINLVDRRDGEIYLVGKLADNKCWMLDNLRLDPTVSEVASAMNSTNTHASAEAIANYLRTDPEATYPDNSADGWSTVAVADVDTDFNSYTEPRINNSYRDATTTGYGAGSKITGIYYNYCAATVGTYCYPQDSTASAGINATNDVCPANWRLPTGGSNGEYQTLCTKVNNNTACTNGMSMTATDPNSLQSKLSTPLSGNYNGSQANLRNGGGYFWSSTRNGNNGMYGLYVYASNVYPQVNGSRYYGFSVRCVAGS